MTYQTEFPDFDPATMPDIPTGWSDQSWHNDACPSFDTGRGMTVFVNFADPELREVPTVNRFLIIGSDNGEVLLESDNWDQCLTFLGEQR